MKKPLRISITIVTPYLENTQLRISEEMLSSSMSLILHYWWVYKAGLQESTVKETNDLIENTKSTKIHGKIEKFSKKCNPNWWITSLNFSTIKLAVEPLFSSLCLLM